MQTGWTTDLRGVLENPGRARDVGSLLQHLRVPPTATLLFLSQVGKCSLERYFSPFLDRKLRGLRSSVGPGCQTPLSPKHLEHKPAYPCPALPWGWGLGRGVRGQEGTTAGSPATACLSPTTV